MNETLPEVPQPAPKSSKMALGIGVAVLVVIGLAMGAYAYFVPVTPEKAMQKMVAAFEKVKQGAFDVTAQVNVTTPSSEVPVNGQAPASNNVSFTFNTSARLDTSNESQTELDGNFSLTGEGIVVRADYRMALGDLYLRVVEVPLLGFFDAGAIENQWIKIDKSVMTEQLGFNVNQDLTPEQEAQMNEAFKQYPPFKLGEKLGDDKIDDVSVRGYSFIVDKANLIAYTKRVAEIQETRQEDMTEISESLDDVDFANGEIWLSKKDYLPYRIKFDVNVSIPEDQTSGAVSIDIKFKDFHEPVDVEVPADAKPFEEVFGTLFGGGLPVMDTPTPDDSLMTDYELMIPEGYY